MILGIRINMRQFKIRPVIAIMGVDFVYILKIYGFLKYELSIV